MSRIRFSWSSTGTTRTGCYRSAEFAQAVRLVEAYVFRRAICAIPTNSLNKTFATFTQERSRRTATSKASRRAFLLLPSYRRFPSDEEFRRDIQDPRPLQLPQPQLLAPPDGEPRAQGARARRRDTRSNTSCRRTRTSPRPGRAELGPTGSGAATSDFTRSGNLTLTGYNSEYSDRPFLREARHEGGFKESPLQLNEGLGQSTSGTKQPSRLAPPGSQRLP